MVVATPNSVENVIGEGGSKTCHAFCRSRVRRETVICHIFSLDYLWSTYVTLSFNEGKFPDKYRKVLVTPLLKKDGLDADVYGNYRPISNLHTISKIVERVFLTRFVSHVKQSPNYNPFQSAYRCRSWHTQQQRCNTAVLGRQRGSHWSCAVSDWTARWCQRLSHRRRKLYVRSCI